MNLDHHARPEFCVGGVNRHTDWQALGHFREIARGVWAGQKGKLARGRPAHADYLAFEGPARKGIDGNVRLGSYVDPAVIGFLYVGVDPDVAGRVIHRNARTRCHILADIDKGPINDTVKLGGNRAVREVDFLQDMPVQDLERVNNADGLTVKKAPQNRVIFFGMNQGADDIEADNVEGKNPLADVRVRKAMSMAINRDAIQQVVMRGQSIPAGMIAPPFVNGWTEAMDAESATDIEGAKALMEEAGYGDGFSIRLDCPNDRYINDEAICQAAVGMLGQIGVTVNLDAKPKAQHFPLITDSKTDFYMLGWGVSTLDSHYVFNYLVKGADKGWNGTGFDDPKINDLILKIEKEVDFPKRDAMIAKIWKKMRDNVNYLPLHHQVIVWAMSDKLDIPIVADDGVRFIYTKFKK